MDYLIAAPPYTHTSGGVRALYMLAEKLREAGYGSTWTNERKGAPADTIVVYPEVISGNPLKAKNVVRWTLNVPGHLGGDAEFDASEYVWTWHPKFYDAPRLTVDLMERDLFHVDDTPKTHDTAYFGKGNHRGVDRVALTRHMPEITRDVVPPWPPTREDVASLLKSTRTLYTYDDCTGIVDEALACGCKVVLLPEGRELAWDDTTASTPEQHEERLAHFIEATQARFA